MKVLHAGCGWQTLPQHLYPGDEEVRLDANPEVKPDIIASIDNLGDIGPFGGIYCSHCLEHLHWDDAHKALREFYRVLDVGGIVHLQVPNLETIQPTEDVVYEVNGLKITGIDLIYGCRVYSRTNPWMMHKSGWTPATLTKAMEEAGFTHIRHIATHYNLEIAGIKL